MLRTLAFVPLAALFSAVAPGAEPKPQGRPADELLAAGVDKAKSQNTKVFLLFGSPG